MIALRVLPLSLAVSLLAVGFAPLAIAAGPNATLVSPSDAATILQTSTVRVHYAGYAPVATNISGYLTLDGISVTTFIRPVSGSPANGTTFNVTMNAAAFASGSHALAAVVFTDLDNPVTTPSRTIVLDKAPTIALDNVTYDLDARDLVVTATIGDDSASAPLVRLVSGPNATNVSFAGTQTIRLHATRAPGTYNGSLNATDALGQTTRAAFSYEVIDREASISTSHVAYDLSQTLRLRGNASDPDGLVSLHVRTELGEGFATVNTNNSTGWYANIFVDPQLGTFNGTLRTTDAWGVTSEGSFTFTIDGPNVTVFEETITTHTGAYADVTTILVPPILGGAIEICVDGCGGNATLSTNNTLRAATAAAYTQICGNGTAGAPAYHSVQCRQLTGRWGQAGSFDLCNPTPPNDLAGRMAYSAWNSVNNFTTRGDLEYTFPGYRPTPSINVGPTQILNAHVTNGTGEASTCRNLFDDANQTADENGDVQGSPPNGVSVVVGRRTTSVAGVPVPGSIECASTGSDATCGYSSATWRTLSLDWAQGPIRTVTVRISGVRV